MIKTAALILVTALFLAACTSYSPDGSKPAGDYSADPLEQAAADLKAAQAVKSEWRFIDKAGGGAARNMSAFLKIAQKKAAEGDIEEAHRIAALVSKYAALGIAQAKAQQSAAPVYP